MILCAVLTALVEGALFLAAGLACGEASVLASPRFLAFSAAVNAVTNLAVSACLALAPPGAIPAVAVALESAVPFAEWSAYRRAVGDRAWLLPATVLANAASLVAGVVLL